jgi:hypothetical protein
MIGEPILRTMEFSGNYKDWLKLKESLSQEYDLIVAKLSNQDFDKMLHEYLNEEQNQIGVGLYTSYFPRKRALVFCQKFLGSYLKLVVENLENFPTYIVFNKSYPSVAKMSFPMRDLFSLSDVLRAVSLTKLLQKRFMMFHGALVKDREGNVVTILSFPDTGKTSTAITLSRKYGFSIYSDDIFYSDGKLAINEPPSHIYVGGAEKNLANRIKLFFLPLASILRYASYVPYMPENLRKISDRIIRIPINSKNVVLHKKLLIPTS